MQIRRIPRSGAAVVAVKVMMVRRRLLRVLTGVALAVPAALAIALPAYAHDRGSECDRLQGAASVSDGDRQGCAAPQGRHDDPDPASGHSDPPAAPDSQPPSQRHNDAKACYPPDPEPTPVPTETAPAPGTPSDTPPSTPPPSTPPPSTPEPPTPEPLSPEPAVAAASPQPGPRHVLVSAAAMVGPAAEPGSEPAAATQRPAIVRIPDSWTFTIDGLDLSDIRPGDTFTISASGLPPGLDVEVELHSTPVTLVRTTVGADGGFAATATIPLDTPPGTHRIVVVLSAPGVESVSRETEVEVTEQGLDPNILTAALAPVTDVLANPGAIASAVALGIVFIVLSTLPAHLLNATVSEQYRRFERRLGRLPAWAERVGRRMSKSSWAGAAGLTAVTAILFGAADPGFGLNEQSLRLVTASAIALFIVAFVSSWLTGRILRIQWAISARVALRPFGLLLTLAGVLASRALDFSPGFLIGLILGLTIPHAAVREYAWRAVAIRSTMIIAFAIAAWVGFTALTLHGEPEDFGGALLVETLVAVTTEGIVMLMVDLLPIKQFEGERLWARSKRLWIVTYLVTTLVFLLGVLSWKGNWAQLGGAIWAWLAALGVFAVIGIGTYLYFRFLAPPLPEEAPDVEDAVGGPDDGAPGTDPIAATIVATGGRPDDAA